MALKSGYNSVSSLHNPGPANYNINRGLGKVSYSFGLKGPSSLLGGTNSPGPGTYALKGSFVYIPGSKIGTSIRDDEFKKAIRIGSPGPGAYRTATHLVHSANKTDSPVFGFGTSSRDNMPFAGKIVSPGPGAYNHKESVGRDG
jgi:hypothetical protein